MQCVQPYTLFFKQETNFSKVTDIDNGSLLQEVIYNSSNAIEKSINYKYQNKISNQNIYGMSKVFNGLRIIVENYSAGQYLFLNSGFTIRDLPITLCTFYPIMGKTTFLFEKETTSFFNNNSKTITTNYGYDTYNNINNTKIVETSAIIPNRKIEETFTLYAYLFDTNQSNLPYQITKKQNDVVIQVQKFYYDNYKDLKIIETSPNEILNFSKNKLYIDIYDDNKNINQFHSENGVNTCFVWGYNKTLPIAKIENVTYDQIQSYVVAIQNASNVDNETALLSALALFRSTINIQFPLSRITTFTHIPLFGLSTTTDIKEDKVTYSYDSFGKLLNVKDKFGNILTENEYHYKP